MPPPHFRVTYTIAARDEPAARAIVDALCLEQTVELPLELVPPGTWIHEHVVGKCESLRRSAWQPKSKGANTAFETTTTTTQRPPHRPHRQSALTRWEAVVRYHDNTTGGEIPQLLNVLFGNTSIKENVMVTDLALSPSLLSSFFGPRHGVRGLREILGVPRGPMLMTALKPMGSDVEALASMAYDFAKGGIDLIKDDHGLANQNYAPYEERVRACCAAVRRANAETGRRCVYAPCLNAPADLIVPRAKFAKACGAGAVLMIPGIGGLDAMRRLAEDPSFGLPIVCHPAILGAMLGGGSDGPDDVPIRGFSHKVLLGILPRLCGADATIFPSFGGRFGFSERECRDIALGSRQKLGSTPAIVPCPGGGMTLERVRKMNEVYGEDVMLLIGGSLMGHSPDLVANARHFLGVAGRQDTYGPLENVRGEHGGFGGVHASSSSSPRLSASERRHRDRSPRAGAVSLSPAPEGAVSLSTAAAHPGRVSLSPAPPRVPDDYKGFGAAFESMTAASPANLAKARKSPYANDAGGAPFAKVPAPKVHHHHPPPVSPSAAPAETAESRELKALRAQYASVEAKLERLTTLVSNGGGGAGAGGTLPPGVAAPPTPVDGNYSKVFHRPKLADWSWDRIPQEMYKMDGASFSGCSRYELLGKRGESTVFHVRYFEVAPGGWTTLEKHEHEHAVVGVRGSGVVQLGPRVYPVNVGDVAYTAPMDVHQLRCEKDAKEPFGFVCVVASDRDRPIEVDPSAFLETISSGKYGPLQHRVREALKTQAAHREKLAGGAGGAVAAGSACEWKPGKKKAEAAAAAAVAEGSACEWTPGKKK